MAALGGSVLTLVDWAKRRDVTGRILPIIELLDVQNSIVNDIPWMEGNMPTGHRVAARTGLPAVAWRLLNQGVTPGKSTVAHTDETCGMMEAWSEVDRDLAELGGNVNEFRYTESIAFAESMRQELASTVFYGNAGLNPEEITGMSVRYSSLSAVNAQNIINGAGGTANQQISIWLIGWGPNSAFGIFPKGTVAGLRHEDKGLVTIQDSTGIGTGRMDVYQEHWQWKVGIALKDWRYAVRFCNIDQPALIANTSPPDLFEGLSKMVHRIPNLNACKPVLYMNRTTFQFLDIQARDQVSAGGGLTYANVDGMMRYYFRGIPIHIEDALLETEAVVS